MAFPYLFDENFALGSLGSFDAETDTESRLSVQSNRVLARTPGLLMPYRGHACAVVDLANDGSPADAYFQETGSFDTAAAGTIFYRFYFCLHRDVAMANNDEFAIQQLWSATNTVEVGVYINYTTADGYRVGLGKDTAAVFKPLTLNEWHCVEVKALIDSGAGDDGTIDGWLDNSAFTQITAQDQGAITSAVFGSLSQDAGTTAGTLYLAHIVADDTRVGPFANRYPHHLVLTSTESVFQGSGTLQDVSLMSGAGTDCVVTLYDSESNSSAPENFVAEIKNTANSQLVNPEDKELHFKRGCFAVLAGTNPRAVVHIKKAAAYFGDGPIRTWALKQMPHPLRIS